MRTIVPSVFNKYFTSVPKAFATFSAIFTLIISLLAPLTVSVPANAAPSEDTLRGIWLSYVDFEPAGLYNKSESDFILAADKVFATLEHYGYNNVFFHVRPFDDAIYPNSSFKWCTYLAPKPLKYDALAYLIEAAHKHNIEFHAWINPYRITIDKIYNPAKKSTTTHIVNGVKEIIENYNVDGIHFDDYFYPSIQKGKQFYKVSVETRKKNVNEMINKVFTTIKDYDANIAFGVSPSGNTEYAKSIGCDLETWINEEDYIDYIIPQLYWSDNYRLGGKKVKYFTKTLKEWTKLNNNKLPIYIGLALYKAGTVRPEDPGWRNNSNNMGIQAKLADKYLCDGYVMFSYQYLFTNEGKAENGSFIKYISGLSLKTKQIKLKKNKRYNISKKVSVNKKYKSAFKFSSSDKTVATVSASGIIHAKKKGRARITVQALGGSKVHCMVWVI